MSNQTVLSDCILLNKNQLEYLFSAEAVRERGKRMLQHCLAGNSHFVIDWSALDPLADAVIALTEQQYPNGIIPLHSRWRHFIFANVDRAAALQNSENFSDLSAQIKAQIDLTLISVLLDAGAGNQWRYYDEETQQYYSRSEGLALATLNMFFAGCFSSVPEQPWRVDADRLITLTPEMISQGMQVSKTNPLPGIAERTSLLNNLSKALIKKFKHSSSIRPGELFSYVLAKYGTSIAAEQLLHIVLQLFNEIWPKRWTATLSTEQEQHEINLGDIGWYPPWGTKENFAALVPFHKLSTWLTLSLIEPLELGQISVTHLDELPGLPEYRNGGLLLDSGLLKLKDPSLAQKIFNPSDSIIIEWRALTLALLDQLAVTIRYKLKLTKNQLPLAAILQGGTWLAGRQYAHKKRSDGSPPLLIKSDGTVF
jgi:hypothetical protein